MHSNYLQWSQNEIALMFTCTLVVRLHNLAHFSMLYKLCWIKLQVTEMRFQNSISSQLLINNVKRNVLITTMRARTDCRDARATPLLHPLTGGDGRSQSAKNKMAINRCQC